MREGVKKEERKEGGKEGTGRKKRKQERRKGGREGDSLGPSDLHHFILNVLSETFLQRLGYHRQLVSGERGRRRRRGEKGMEGAGGYGIGIHMCICTCH